MVGLFFVGQGIRYPMVDTAVFVEENRELAKLSLAVAAHEEVNVIPAVGMELISDKRHAEQELHLSVRHPFF